MGTGECAGFGHRGAGQTRYGPDSIGAAIAPSRASVVLAETDPAIASQLMHAAAEIGIETTWCRDGAEALLVVGAEAA